MTTRLARGELEARVMDLLWSQDDWMTPAQVHAAIRRRPPLVYTTILNVLVRLWNKGMLDRRRRGRAYEYRPFAPREEWAAQRMLEILQNAGDKTAALTHFVNEISGADAIELHRVLGRAKPRA